MQDAFTLIGLFVSALLAASPIPLQSEVVFVATQIATAIDPWLLVLVAGVGNTLGSFITYGLGRGARHWQGRSWFPATPAQMTRAEAWFQRWGVWALLLSWAPGGDLATLVAGVLRTPLWIFTILVGCAKFGRYAALAWLTARAMGLPA